MIDAFEARATDLLADLLATAPEVQQVTRAADGLPAPLATRAQVRLWVGAARPWPHLGDDRQEVLGAPGALGLRPVLRLSGELIVELEVAKADGVVAPGTQRKALAGALDRVLVALNDGGVRDGTAFATGVDQGFELEGFRLDRVEPVADAPEDFRRTRAVYAYAGRFWPVQPATAGAAIQGLATRTVVLQGGLPRGLSARAGGPDLVVPLALDLRATAGATPRLAARLLGASPPGALVGDATGLPAGLTGAPRAPDGRYLLTYRPPATTTGKTQVRVELSLAQAPGDPIVLGDFSIEVTA